MSVIQEDGVYKVSRSIAPTSYPVRYAYITGTDGAAELTIEYKDELADVEGAIKTALGDAVTSVKVVEQESDVEMADAGADKTDKTDEAPAEDPKDDQGKDAEEAEEGEEGEEAKEDNEGEEGEEREEAAEGAEGAEAKEGDAAEEAAEGAEAKEGDAAEEAAEGEGEGGETAEEGKQAEEKAPAATLRAKVLLEGRVLGLVTAPHALLTSESTKGLITAASITGRTGWHIIDRHEGGSVLQPDSVDLADRKPPTGTAPLPAVAKAAELFCALKEAVPAADWVQGRFLRVGSMERDISRLAFLAVSTMSTAAREGTYLPELRMRLCDLFQTRDAVIDKAIQLDAESSSALFGTPSASPAPECCLVHVDKETVDMTSFSQRAMMHLTNGKLGYITQHPAVVLRGSIFYDTLQNTVLQEADLAEAATDTPALCRNLPLAVANINLLLKAWDNACSMFDGTTVGVKPLAVAQPLPASSTLDVWRGDAALCLADILCVTKAPEGDAPEEAEQPAAVPDDAAEGDGPDPRQGWGDEGPQHYEDEEMEEDGEQEAAWDRQEAAMPPLPPGDRPPPPPGDRPPPLPAGERPRMPPMPPGQLGEDRGMHESRLRPREDEDSPDEGPARKKNRKQKRAAQAALLASPEGWFAVPSGTNYIEDEEARARVRDLILKHGHMSPMREALSKEAFFPRGHTQLQMYMHISGCLMSLKRTQEDIPEIEENNGKIQIREVLEESSVADVRTLGYLHCVARVYQGNVLVSQSRAPWERRLTALLDAWKKSVVYLALLPQIAEDRVSMVEKEKINTRSILTRKMMRPLYRFGVDELWEGHKPRPKESPNMVYNKVLQGYLKNVEEKRNQLIEEKTEAVRRQEELEKRQEEFQKKKQQQEAAARERKMEAEKEQRIRDRQAAEAARSRLRDERDRDDRRSGFSDDPRPKEDRRPRDDDRRPLRDDDRRPLRDDDRRPPVPLRDDDRRPLRDDDRRPPASAPGGRGREYYERRNRDDQSARPARGGTDRRAVDKFLRMLEDQLRDVIKRSVIENLTKEAFANRSQAPEFIEAWELRVSRIDNAKASLACWYLLDALLKAVPPQDNPFLTEVDKRIVGWGRFFPAALDRSKYDASRRLIDTWEGLLDTRTLDKLKDGLDRFR